ncbi:hypothetical protein ACN469_20380 [Corallococcus terminator]
MATPSRSRFLIPLLTGMLGYGVAWMRVPPHPGNDAFAEAFARQDSKLEALTAQLARVEARLAESQTRAPPERGPSSAMQAAVPEPLPSSPESVAALAQGQQLIRDAADARRWGPHEVAELRRLMQDMTGHQQFEVMRQLSVAINSGAIHASASAILRE